MGGGSSIGVGSTIGREARMDIRCTLMPNSILPSHAHLKSFSIISANDHFEEGQVINHFYKTNFDQDPS